MDVLHLENIFYVYLHIKESDGTPFYVGKGKKNRAYIKGRRNKEWYNISNDGYDIIILEDELYEDESLLREIYWIDRIGRKINGGLLINKTDGGEGTSGLIGHKHSEETKKKISEKAKLRKPITNETRKKLRDAILGKKRLKKYIKKHNIGYNNKFILDINTGIFYDDCVESAFLYDTNRKHINRMLNGDNKNKTSLRYV